VFGNTRTKYYPLGDDCYDDILEALRGAERYIFIEYFIIEEGKLWNSVLDIAREKAARGVEVRVIYDDIGSICRGTTRSGWSRWAYSAGCLTALCLWCPCGRTTGITGSI
jgi:phosphatidylserine/phosphatidylglycerophosphate/cardiolipin synthase-like enzyme